MPVSLEQLVYILNVCMQDLCVHGVAGDRVVQFFWHRLACIEDHVEAFILAEDLSFAENQSFNFFSFDVLWSQLLCLPFDGLPVFFRHLPSSVTTYRAQNIATSIKELLQRICATGASTFASCSWRLPRYWSLIPASLPHVGQGGEHPILGAAAERLQFLIEALEDELPLDDDAQALLFARVQVSCLVRSHLPTFFDTLMSEILEKPARSTFA